MYEETCVVHQADSCCGHVAVAVLCANVGYMHNIPVSPMTVRHFCGCWCLIDWLFKINVEHT